MVYNLILAKRGSGERKSVALRGSDCQHEVWGQQQNTLRPEQNGRHVAHDICKCIFLNEYVVILSKISLKYVHGGLNEDISALVQVMAWCRQAASHNLNQCWPRFMLPYDVMRSQWVNTMPPTETWEGNAVFIRNMKVIFCVSCDVAKWWEWRLMSSQKICD